MRSTISLNIVNIASKEVFISITAGGGIRRKKNLKKFFNGVDIIRINLCQRIPEVLNDIVYK